jgi:hypothetical protein
MVQKQAMDLCWAYVSYCTGCWVSGVSHRPIILTCTAAAAGRQWCKGLNSLDPGSSLPLLIDMPESSCGELEACTCSRSRKVVVAVGERGRNGLWVKRGHAPAPTTGCLRGPCC